MDMHRMDVVRIKCWVCHSNQTPPTSAVPHNNDNLLS